MTPHERLISCLLLVAFAGACECRNPNVQRHLNPEGTACSDDAECETGLCEALPGKEKLCTRKCTDGCRSNEICEPLVEGRYACVPDKAALCQPCESDADCPYPGDRCIQVAGTNVCGRDCSFNGACPDSFQCAQAVGFDGALLTTQCVATSGTCECTAASDGQTLPCESTNASGTCMGVRTCNASTGYSACDARVPAEESCNGIDDNCNGQIDEDLGSTTCGVGACVVTVDNCVNGMPSQCVPREPMPEICDEVDNDCDMQVDEDFDKEASVTTCGTCDNDCTKKLTAAQPHATPRCDSGQCALDCDTLFGDCDATFATGCEQDLSGDINNCGGCGVKCASINGTATCDMGVCALACDPGWADCDGLPNNGCETHVATDLANCGTCGHVCPMPPNAVASCTNSQCGLGCATDWWDIDGDPSNGCEYNCVFQSATDLPDLAFTDSNCDGLDGEVANGIFVAPPVSGGNDANPGTRSAPKATLAGGMAAAVAQGKRDVYVATGTYVESLAITSPNKGVYGGYDKTTWARSLSNTVTVTGVNRPLFIDNANGAQVQLISFIGANASGVAQTAYGAFIRNSQQVQLTSVLIRAGSGSDGLSGANGVQGASGGNGAQGQPGVESGGPWWGVACQSKPRPQGGNGGTSVCGRTGGKGGAPGHETSAGDPGGTGVGGTPGGNGVPPHLGNVTPGAPYIGAPGTNGSPGAPGSSGGAIGTVSAAGYVPAATTDGAPGGHGNGGGGGGGG
ncbi:MAG: hypothetical protein IRZ16_12975, partial [Myxococcaceae bacterium]|nr:hypothetical protein [Myxococcaceae bacterium]